MDLPTAQKPLPISVKSLQKKNPISADLLSKIRVSIAHIETMKATITTIIPIAIKTLNHGVTTIAYQIQ